MKSFKYAGRTFKPADIKRNGSLTFSELSDMIRSMDMLFVSNRYQPAFPHVLGGWSWDEFYAAAKKEGCGKYDVFEVDGALCVPGAWCLWYDSRKIR